MRSAMHNAQPALVVLEEVSRVAYKVSRFRGFKALVVPLTEAGGGVADDRREDGAEGNGGSWVGNLAEGDIHGNRFDARRTVQGDHEESKGRGGEAARKSRVAEAELLEAERRSRPSRSRSRERRRSGRRCRADGMPGAPGGWVDGAMHGQRCCRRTRTGGGKCIGRRNG